MMFGFFNKKSKPHTGKIDSRSLDVLATAAAMLEMQLMLCKAEKSKYNEFFHGRFVRGYLIGFFDASIQYANIHVDNEGHLELLLASGHTCLLNGNVEEAIKYVLDSSALQGIEEYDKAQGQGGSEYFDFVNEKKRSPIGLMRRFTEMES